jgi:2-amino-4-hydroxy-6-hydroxymethyldihydropteridine diphosphokinase
MSDYRVFVGLGSNLGDRAGMLNRAAREIASIDRVRVVQWSPVYETEPVGRIDQPKFLNAVGELETGLPPVDLLRELLSIEARMGRIRGERWGPRAIDLDILLYEGLVQAGPEVTVPHPELEHRRFVLVPFRELDPDVVHPVNGMTIGELADACSGQGRVQRTSYHIKA